MKDKEISSQTTTICSHVTRCVNIWYKGTATSIQDLNKEKYSSKCKPKVKIKIIECKLTLAVLSKNKWNFNICILYVSDWLLEVIKKWCFNYWIVVYSVNQTQKFSAKYSTSSNLGITCKVDWNEFKIESKVELNELIQNLNELNPRLNFCWFEWV